MPEIANKKPVRLRFRFAGELTTCIFYDWLLKAGSDAILFERSHRSQFGLLTQQRWYWVSQGIVMSTLTIENIHKSYGEIATLRGIDIQLESGEFLVLLGSSGCGKSTLLNIIAGLSEPTSGEIRIADRPVVGVHPKDRDIAMVFQSYALYPNLSVRRNIGFALEMRGVPKAERDRTIEETAQMLQIESLLDRRPSQLSGGQRQRVAIGRALVRNPKIFLFDEPLSNLDAKLRMELRTELKRLHQILKTTVVYVTHDQIEAMTLATRIAVMRNGQVEQLGTPEAIYNRPATLYVASFVGAPPINLLKGRWTSNGVKLDGSDVVLPFNRAELGGGTEEEVTVGIRAEAFHTGSAEFTLDVVAEVAELTGPELIVTGTFGDRDKISASLPPQTKIQPSSIVRLGVNFSDLHLFDSASGNRLN
ncbi:sugar ABC transporter ATP-binding protein [Sinorhizobium fredii]|uniref:Sugar ABC transporter ATP-binding protein n=1 Tax=Rhizobium fredii TaxID=380 RepID=A0A2A6M6C3_RHIFR|nr:sn-glycerol-3-phosphate ABC transporter ATP-binding protein UgpC [Sinorhizobium fredii]PDT50158.1 sugar ABC transporter ATP-binding protein [Sinorhizobium fredii]